jgi:phosphate transport system substrate-binding protein
MMRKTLTAWFSGLLVTVVIGCSGNGGTKSAGSVGALSGGGSSFINPLMKKWSAEYYRAHDVQVDYASTGSTNGIADMITRKIDFGCTDAPMTDEQLSKARAAGGEVVHLPLVIGGVVPIYNLEGIDKPLNFTGKILADIYLGKIKKWNHSDIQQANAGVNLPNVDILTVHRSDGSGTTDIFTDYLSKVSDEWRKGPGHGTQIDWPAGGVGEPKNPGVAGHVQRTAGAIGYVELIYALESKLPYGAVENREHKFVRATLESVTAAADNALADIPKDLRYSITDAKGETSYPICGTTWAVLYQKPDPAKAQALGAFFRWATHEGQAMTTELQYSALPKGLVERVDEKLNEQLKPLK